MAMTDVTPTDASTALHVVLGAGPVGVTLARQLAGQGQQVRLVSRRGLGPTLPGVSLVRADASSAAALAAAVVDADGDEEAGERAAQALRYAEDALDHEVVNRLHDLTDIKQERARRDAVFSDVVRAHLRCPTLDRLLGSRPADDPE